MAPKDEVMNARVSKLETKFDSIEQKLDQLVLQSTVKLQDVENAGRTSVLEYKHQLELLNAKVSELQRWQKVLLGILVTIGLAVGGNVATTITQILAKSAMP